MEYGKISKSDLVFIRNKKFNSYTYYWETFLGFVRAIEGNLYIIEPYYCTRHAVGSRESIYEAYCFPELIPFYNVMPNNFNIPIDAVKYNLKPELDKPRVSHAQKQVMAIHLNTYYKDESKELKRFIYQSIDKLLNSENVYIDSNKYKNVRVVGNIKKKMRALGQQEIPCDDIRKNLKLSKNTFNRYIDGL